MGIKVRVRWGERAIAGRGENGRDRESGAGSRGRGGRATEGGEWKAGRGERRGRGGREWTSEPGARGAYALYYIILYYITYKIRVVYWYYIYI